MVHPWFFSQGLNEYRYGDSVYSTISVSVSSTRASIRNASRLRRIGVSSSFETRSDEELCVIQLYWPNLNMTDGPALKPHYLHPSLEFETWEAGSDLNISPQIVCDQ